MTVPQPRKKLIEVALPLDDINAACKSEKDRKTGTLRSLHKWFAPMPPPAWRALLFAALVDDPADVERRAYLLDLIKRLVASGSNLPDPDFVDEARKIIADHYPEGVPLVFDPFCGGGSTLVEGQRLGLASFGSDLNPVPALITRTLTQMLPQARNKQPVHSAAASSDNYALIGAASKVYAGYEGLEADVMHYAERVREKALKQLESLFPARDGETPIAWLWARTATCNNPACGVETVLTTSWSLLKRTGANAWIEPSATSEGVVLNVVSKRASGSAPAAPKLGRGASFACIRCDSVIEEQVIVEQAQRHGLGVRMTCVVSDVDGRRIFRNPTSADIAAASAAPEVADFPNIRLPDNPRWFSGPRFGIKTQADVYTRRQLHTLSVITSLVAETRQQVLSDGGDEQWADLVTTVLGLALGGLAIAGSTQSRWRDSGWAEAAFGRNDLPMTWDFAETFFAGDAVGDWRNIVKRVIGTATKYSAHGHGTVVRSDARTSRPPSPGLVATDPPYFDAIGYADLSDYFYVWHRRALRDVHPDLYNTLAAPKSGELTAVPSHHGGSRDAARAYFIEGFTETFRNLQQSMAPGLPMLVVYASKEQKGGGEEETRWSSILTAMVQTELEVTGTWPIHGTGSSRMVGQGANAVATYVVMVCRPRLAAAGTCSLADFNRALRRELRPAVHDFQAAGILPVDLAQAALGPGMQVYSRYRQVLDQSGKQVSVEQALRLINAAREEVLDEQEGELDPYSRFAVAWWDKYGWSPGAFGVADKVARPQGISVDDVVRAGVARYARPGYVELLGSGSLDKDWRPTSDSQPTAWEAVHHLADRLIDGGGTSEAGRLLSELGVFRDPAQALVYRLNVIAAKRNRTADQERYNALIGSWSDLLANAANEMDGLF